MIFVTVGTHEQSFNRLVRAVDELKRDGVIAEEVIIQTGYSTYEPKYCQWSKLIPYQEMIKNVEKAHIVITHGGPASFIMPLQIGKTPIVVPRQGTILCRNPHYYSTAGQTVSIKKSFCNLKFSLSYLIICYWIFHIYSLRKRVTDYKLSPDSDVLLHIGYILQCKLLKQTNNLLDNFVSPLQIVI